MQPSNFEKRSDVFLASGLYTIMIMIIGRRPENNIEKEVIVRTITESITAKTEYR
jgi:hypothetical protein